MSLSEKANKIFNELMRQKDLSEILISKEEFDKALIKRDNSLSDLNKKNLSLDKNFLKFDKKPCEINEDLNNLNSIRIQKSEIENLFNKKNVETSNKKINYSEINILDKLLSNTKIFLKNLIYIQDEKDLYFYLDKNLSTLFYFKSYCIFFQNKIVHSYNMSDYIKKKIENFSNNFPDQFENTFSLVRVNSLVNYKTLKENCFIFPIFLKNKNQGYIFIEIDENYSKNEYYLDFVALLLTLIPSSIPSILS